MLLARAQTASRPCCTLRRPRCTLREGVAPACPVAPSSASERLRIELVALEPALHLHARLAERARNGGHVAAVLTEQRRDLVFVPELGLGERPHLGRNVVA